MSLRVAFDIDGVFADMRGCIAREAESLFADENTPSGSRLDSAARQLHASLGTVSASTGEDVPDVAAGTPLKDITPGKQRRLWRRLRTIENFWERLEETEPGALAQLATVANECRWETIFLTSRPGCAGATVQVQTQRWLESKGFALPSVYVVQGSRGRIAAALSLDVVVDDTLANCLDVVAESSARALLMWREEGQLPASTERYGIGVVRSAAECLEQLTSMTRPGRRGRVADRVRRFFGARRLAAKPTGRVVTD